jgi:hypothetical protein
MLSIDLNFMSTLNFRKLVVEWNDETKARPAAPTAA